MVNINIAFAVNDPYIRHLNVTIYSILQNNPAYKFTFFILCESLTDRSKKMINVIKMLNNNVDIKIVELNDKKYGFSKFVIPKNINFITKEMYFRYALPKVLKNIDRVLYLDADLIALGDIGELYNENIDEYYVAGVIDAGIATRFPEHLPNLGMQNEDIYINSGVLLMNLVKMREDSIFEKLLGNTKKYEKILLFPDQDILNLTLKGFIKSVSPIYNFTDQNMLDDAISIDDIKIVHFTGGIKPWHNTPQTYTKRYVDRYINYKDVYHNLVLKRLSLLISIIVPIYNTEEKYLKLCLESIKRQTYSNIEVILIDDGSQQETARFVDGYAEGLSNWRVIHQKNTGVNMARKAGFDESRGDFVTFVDSDDTLVDIFCEHLYKTAVKTDADVIIAERYDIENDELVTPINEDNQADDVLGDKNSIIKAHRITPFGMNSWGATIWGALYKRELIKEIDWEFSNYTIAEDEFWTPQTKVLSSIVAYVHEQLYCYRTNRHLSRSKTIKPIYFNGDGENRKIPYISLGIEIFHKNSELFKKYKSNLPEEPFLYGVSVTKRLVNQLFEADKLKGENITLAKSIAKQFLDAIKNEDLNVDGSIILDLKLLETNPEIFVRYVSTTKKDRVEVERLRAEAVLRDSELELLRQPGIKLALRKLAGAFRRRLIRGFIGRTKRKIKNIIAPPAVEVFDRRYSKRKGMRKIVPSKKFEGRYIVTLTSYGDRIKTTAPRAVYSILSGRDLPDKLILWLAHGEEVSKSLKKMEQYGLEIRFTKDIKSYKKLIPSLKEYPNDILITADDDVYYPHTWLAELKRIHNKNPDKIIANRADTITFHESGKIKSYSDFSHGKADNKTNTFIPTGVGGILYPPNSLNENVLTESQFMELSDSNDDIWFWAMALLNKTEFVLTDSVYGNVTTNPLISISHDSSEPTLWEMTNSQSGDNRSTTALRNILERWPEIEPRIKAQR